jgi:hypothetical protein
VAHTFPVSQSCQVVRHSSVIDAEMIRVSDRSVCYPQYRQANQPTRKARKFPGFTPTSNKHAPGKYHPRNVPISPPPCRLKSQVGKRVAQHARLQSRAQTKRWASCAPQTLGVPPSPNSGRPARASLPSSDPGCTQPEPGITSGLHSPSGNSPPATPGALNTEPGITSSDPGCTQH